MCGGESELWYNIYMENSIEILINIKNNDVVLKTRTLRVYHSKDSISVQNIEVLADELITTLDRCHDDKI